MHSRSGLLLHRLAALVLLAATLDVTPADAQSQTPISRSRRLSGNSNFVATGSSLRTQPNTVNPCAVDATRTFTTVYDNAGTLLPFFGAVARRLPIAAPGQRAEAALPAATFSAGRTGSVARPGAGRRDLRGRAGGGTTRVHPVGTGSICTGYSRLELDATTVSDPFGSFEIDGARLSVIDAAGITRLAAQRVQKLAEVLSERVNGTSNPRRIPGAIVRYAVSVTNPGPARAATPRSRSASESACAERGHQSQWRRRSCQRSRCRS